MSMALRIYVGIPDPTIDSTGNLPMTRVKYNARADYEYLDNFKILQACFKKNGVDKVSSSTPMKLQADELT